MAQNSKRRAESQNHTLDSYFIKRQAVTVTTDDDSRLLQASKSAWDASQNESVSSASLVGYCSHSATSATLLTCHWSPPQNYYFPYSLQTKTNKEGRRFASYKHLDSF
ncbi:hypothetical protein PR048_007978 [Dryococelus australis]|uniref:Uncharacterized protein n=1 Tax=Dryococelus australis TaxID=614101 RepID=A0ABQ9HW49_9NEOP|nr:hypothetical protein PR048_007978 [Dryococelus australis]